MMHANHRQPMLGCDAQLQELHVQLDCNSDYAKFENFLLKCTPLCVRHVVQLSEAQQDEPECFLWCSSTYPIRGISS